ncbi:hypothetical protein Pyn_15583 [Prunus yedoensis var. nudiflora]|uniref:Uncharacterized protein n=1 Tax=Prunus yedoensis var. nudiflora TaxID=2094558 RepID=A0A314USY5_PRUYE|nr:hypothetical protein Pyn_15583 [Prunus yedoensis var. nudiflora]
MNGPSLNWLVPKLIWNKLRALPPLWKKARQGKAAARVELARGLAWARETHPLSELDLARWSCNLALSLPPARIDGFAIPHISTATFGDFNTFIVVGEIIESVSSLNILEFSTHSQLTDSLGFHHFHKVLRSKSLFFLSIMSINGGIRTCAKLLRVQKHLYQNQELEGSTQPE